jgi:signal transduction histidine kinase
MIRGLCHIALILCSLLLVGQSHDRGNDSIRWMIRTSDGEDKINHYQTMITRNWLNLPDTARKYSLEAIRFAEDQKNDRFRAIAIRLYGGFFLYTGNYDSSLWCSRESLRLTLIIGDSVLMSSALNNIGSTHYYFGNYPMALENLYNSLAIKNRIKNESGLSSTLNNIGLVYTKLKNYDQARTYLFDALQSADKMNDGSAKMYILNNIGITYLEQGNTLEARKYFERSIEESLRVNNANRLAGSHVGLGRVYLKLDSKSKARQHLNESLKLRLRLGDKRGISEVYFHLAELMEMEGKLDSAFFYLRASQRLALSSKMADRALGNFKMLTRLHRTNKRSDSAFYYQTRYINLSDSLFNENLARDLADIHMRLRDQEVERALAEKDYQLHRKTILTRLFTVIFIVTLLFSGMLLLTYTRQRKLSQMLANTNSELTRHKEEIEQQKDQLLRSNVDLETAKERIQLQNIKLAELNKELNSMVEKRTQELDMATRELSMTSLELDHLIYKSSHDIKGPLVRLMSICHVALLEIQDEEARKYIGMMSDTARQLNEIFDRLATIRDINMSLQSTVQIDFHVLLDKVLPTLKNLQGFDEVKIQREIEDGMVFKSDPFLLETIFLNMLDNAIRFQQNSGLVEKQVIVRIFSIDGQLKITFLDNGIGIKESDMKHIFEMFSKAALEHHNIGLGLYVVKQCVTRLNGSIALKPNSGKFTEFEITLPIQS